ncbi:MAG: hypothetical protein ACJ789_16090 [Thermomicrobiales bacterium]
MSIEIGTKVNILGGDLPPTGTNRPDGTVTAVDTLGLTLEIAILDAALTSKIKHFFVPWTAISNVEILPDEGT